MKVIFILLIVGGFILPFFLKGPTGEPILSISDFIPEKPDLSVVTNTLDSVTSQGEPEQETTLYRYQDEQGNWQFTDQAPIDGNSYETVEVSEVNVIQSVEARPVQQSQTPTAPTSVSGYVEGMQTVVEDAQNVQNLMDDRESQLQEALKNSQ